MRWDQVIPAVVALLRADAARPAALERTAIHEARDATAVTVPGLTWYMVSDIEEEVWNPILTQWDVFARDWAEMAVLEGWIRGLLHADLPQVIGGIRMWTQLVDARTLPVPEDMNPGLVHRQLDIRLTAARSKYER